MGLGHEALDVPCLKANFQGLGHDGGRFPGSDDVLTRYALTDLQNGWGIVADSPVAPVGLSHLTRRNLGNWSGQRARTRETVLNRTVVPPEVGCLNGVDNNVDLSGVANCLKTNGYSFVLRYLGGPCYNGVALTSGEVQALTSAGLMVGTIYVGANRVSAFTCGMQTFSQGQLDGAACAGLAQAIGQPSDSAIYLDLQGDQISSQASWLAYVQGWASIVSSHGYRPGVYSSPRQLQVIEGQPWGGDALLYWVAHWISVGPIVPPPCPTTEFSSAVLWQYSDGTCICGIPGFDIDSMQTPAGFFA